MTEPGLLIAHRYRLVELLARGGMGTVWRAQDERLQRQVAVKLLHAPSGAYGADAELAAERALREARITARLHHPHAVPVFDVVEHEGRPCLVMQYLPSRSLQAILDEAGALPAERVARIGAELAGALAAAHRAGIIHRDVKPANVLVTDDGTAKLTDFGISHALGDASLTSTGLVTGTPTYLAPEVARGADAGFASDVYSLGSTLYRAVEGSPPYGDGTNAIAVLHRVASGRFVPPTPDGLLTPLLLQMLAVDPATRPPMHNVALTLQQLAAGPRARVVSAGRPATAAAPRPPAEDRTTTPVPTTPPTPRPTTPPPATPRPAAESGPVAPEPAPRRRTGWITGAVLAVLLVAGLVVAVLHATGGGSGRQAGGTTTPAASQDAAPGPTGVTSPPSGSSPAASPSPSDTPSPADTGVPTATELTDALTSYYAALPADTDAGWARLTTRYQADPAGGRDGYDRFWGGIRSIAVGDVQATPPGTVVATLTYVFTDGSTSSERTSFGFVRDGGVLKIDSSQVLSRG